MGTETSDSPEHIDDKGDENVPAKRPRLSQLTSPFNMNNTAGPSISRNLVSSSATTLSSSISSTSSPNMNNPDGPSTSHNIVSSAATTLSALGSTSSNMNHAAGPTASHTLTSSSTTTSTTTPAPAVASIHPIVKPPFLIRNHIGYKTLKRGGTLNDVKQDVTMITQPGWSKNGKRKKKHDPEESFEKILDYFLNVAKILERPIQSNTAMVQTTPKIRTLVLFGDIADDNAITYEVDPLCKENMLLFCYPPPEQQNDKRKNASMPQIPSESYDQSGQVEAASCKCLICAKTFCSYDHLKFHLEHTYPSFVFDFSSTVIKVTLSASYNSSGKLSSGQAEVLIKNIMDLPACSDSYVHLPHAVQPETYGFALSTRYSDKVPSLNRHPPPKPKSKKPDPNLDLYKHLVPLQAINQTIENFLHEFEDVEESEKKFLYLWNTFIYRQTQHGLVIMYKQLLKFIQENYDLIQELKLWYYWNELLLNFKFCKMLNQDQFLALSFYRTPIEKTWYGNKTLKLEIRKPVAPKKPKIRRRKAKRN